MMYNYYREKAIYTYQLFASSMLLLLLFLVMAEIQSTYSFHISSYLQSSDSFTKIHYQPLQAEHCSKLHHGSNIPQVRSKGSSTKLLFSTRNRRHNYIESKGQGKQQKRRKPQNKSVAIRWVVESIEKVIKNERRAKLKNNIQKGLIYEGRAKLKNNDLQSNDERNNKFSQITIYGGTNTQDDDLKLMDALRQIYMGKSKQDIVKAGNKIGSLKICEKYSFSIQERVMKLAAMAGLIQLSCEILDSMINDQNYVPSSMGYVSVLNGLRKLQKLDVLEKTMNNLSDACKKTNHYIDTVALNSYLGALCDAARSSRDYDHSSKLLSDAVTLLEPNVARERYAVHNGPDVISYNTVLNAALSTSRQNSSLVEDILQMMKKNGIVEDIYTYNLRLKAYGKGVASTADKIALIDEILSHPILTPDKFTIEQALLPLAKEGRIGDILEILWQFNNSQKESPISLSNAYSTFFIALVKGGEVDIARSIFDTYILPPRVLNQGSRVANKHGLFESPIRPITRHFNVLIDGYGSLNERESKASSGSDKHATPLEHCNALFETMIESSIKPDVYTISSLMGLQETSSSVSNLWQKAVQLQVPMTPPVYHSLITAYGRTNDPSSACYVFDRMIRTRSLSNTLNSWNVLLSALSQTYWKEAQIPIACLQSSAHKSDDYLDSDLSTTKLLPGGKTFSELIEGKDVMDASFEILKVMKDATNSDYHKSWILRPNSQSYCLVASTIAHRRDKQDGDLAMDLYRDSMKWKIPADGRFINAVIRSFGNDIDGAINAWKSELRSAVASCENRERPRYSKHKKGKNLIAAYHGLIHVAGKAGRPDIALRITYAMKKEGLEPNESTLNSYKTGVRDKKRQKNIRLNEQYENLLVVECSKYSQLDKRRSSEKRVRIII